LTADFAAKTRQSGGAAGCGTGGSGSSTSLRKLYLALVSGSPVADSGAVDVPIGRVQHAGLCGGLWAADAADGKPARSTWYLLRRLPESGASVLAVEIFSGGTLKFAQTHALVLSKRSGSTRDPCRALCASVHGACASRCATLSMCGAPQEAGASICSAMTALRRWGFVDRCHEVLPAAVQVGPIKFASTWRRWDTRWWATCCMRREAASWPRRRRRREPWIRRTGMRCQATRDTASMPGKSRCATPRQVLSTRQVARKICRAGQRLALHAPSLGPRMPRVGEWA